MHFAGGTNAYYLTDSTSHTWVGDWLDEASQFTIATTGIGEHEVLSAISQGARRKDIIALAQRSGVETARIRALLDEAITHGAIYDPPLARPPAERETGRLLAPVKPELRSELWRQPSAEYTAERSALTIAIEGEKILGARLDHDLAQAGITARATSCPDVVIRIDTSLPDPTRLTELRLAEQTYLSISTSASCLAVGPLVIPGITPCITCANHRRTCEDPNWPALAMQLQEVSYPHPEEPIVAAALACAVMQMIAVAHSRLPVTIGAMAVFSPRLSFPAIKRFGPHPQCGCGAGRPNPWGL